MSASLVALQSLERRGLLTKEASARIRAKREALIKEAISLPFGKKPKPMSLIGKLMHKEKPPAADGFGHGLAQLAKLVGVGAGIAAGGAGVGAAARGLANMGQDRRVKKSREQVLESLKATDPNPAAHKVHETIFNVIAEYAPSLAANPVVAHSMVSALAPGGVDRAGVPKGIDSNMVKSLIAAQATINESGSKRGFFNTFSDIHSRQLPNAAKFVDPQG